jgi:hypothetical protein
MTATVGSDLDSWSLTDVARGQLEGCGIAYSELYRLVRKPVLTIPGLEPGTQRWTGYGLTIIVCDREIRAVEIDGATSANWADWAVERATFGDGDVAGADALIAEEIARRARERTFLPRARRVKPAPPPLMKTHILDRIHPALHAEITRLVAGDFSRLVIHSPTRVKILPLP